MGSVPTFRKRGRHKESAGAWHGLTVVVFALPSNLLLPAGEGIFCFLFVAAWTKRKASGGTRPAGFAFFEQAGNLAYIA